MFIKLLQMRLSTFSVPKQLACLLNPSFCPFIVLQEFPEIKCDMASTLPPINFHPTQQNLLWCNSFLKVFF